MTGKAYYITTLADWQRHAPRFANSHFIVLEDDSRSAGFQPANSRPNAEAENRRQDAGATNGAPRPPLPVEARDFSPAKTTGAERPSVAQLHLQHVVEVEGSQSSAMLESTEAHPTLTGRGDNRKILVLIEADEGVHLSLEDDAAFEPLPHPLAQKPISDAAQSALAPHGVAPGATTFDAAEALARVHPLLKHRVF